MTFDEALNNWLNNKSNGIGFILTKDDPFLCIDLDNCVSEKGRVDNHAAEIVSKFNSYTELSPSGRGIHIWCKGKLPKAGIKTKRWEAYQSGRYMTVTMNRICGEIIENQEAIEWLLASGGNE